MSTQRQCTAASRSAGQLSELHAALSDRDLTDRFRELELATRRLTAERALVVAEAARRGIHATDRHHSIAGWLRANAGWSPGQVSVTRRLAALVQAHPAVADALLDGRIGTAQADELARLHANPRCGHVLGDALDVLIDQAQHLPFPDFRTCTRRWETLADLDGAYRDRSRSVEHRNATVIGDRDGVVVAAAGGTALQAAELAGIFEVFVQAELQADVDEVRRSGSADDAATALARSDRQRRFDALVAIFRTANASDAPPAPAPATVDVLVDLDTFERAVADHGLRPAPDPPPPDPTAPDPERTRCETTTGIPLLPDDIVGAALTGWVRRVVVDSASVVTDLGRRQRVFTGPAREAAKLLARRCQYPGCVVPAVAAQVDHVAEWHRHRGHTDTANAMVLCGRHNRWKYSCVQARRDRAGRVHFRRPDGSWLTPVGRPPPDEADLVPLDT